MDGSTKKIGRIVRAVVFFITLIITAFIPVNAAQTYSEAVSASCYKGDPEEGNCIGNLTVIVPEGAGKGCNSMYSGCEGKCTGCVSEFDFGGDICYDSAGKKFLR
jgi:hypothetical protein